jgi:hypothetical protein
METAFHYTFTTIAQALAAMIALVGAFVLYRAQLLGSDLLQAAAVIRTHSGVLDGAVMAEMTAAHIAGDYRRVFQLARDNHPPPFRTELNAGFTTFEKLDSQRTSLLRSFAISVFVSTIVIGGSVVLLALTPTIIRSHYAGWYLTGGCIGFCVCLLLYAYLLLRQLPWAKG